MGGIWLNNENEIHKYKDHSCNESEDKRKAVIARYIIKEKLQTTNEPFLRTVTEITRNLSIPVAGNLPKFESIRVFSIRDRNARNSFLLNAENDIPPSLRVSLNGSNFLQYDSGSGSRSRFIIFFNEDFRIYLQNIKTFIIDGTFKSSPREFYQILTLQGFLFGRYLPLIFIMMSDKSEATYVQIFDYIQNNNIINPKNIIIDFENALKNSLSTFRSNPRVFGCNFHFGQAVWRRIQNLGLAENYRNDLVIRKIFRMFLNLVFINQNMLNVAYDFIINKIISLEILSLLSEFISYFERTYIGRENVVPLFNNEFWNVSERIILNLPRTTNTLEGWHRNFNKIVNTANPNIGRLTDSLQQET